MVQYSGGNADMGKYISRYRTARASMLTMCGLTVVNILLNLFGIGFYFPFSASFPQFCIYPSLLAGDSLDKLVFAVLLIVALVALAALFTSWALSKKHFAFSIVSLILFSFDCFILLALILLALSVGTFDGYIIIDVAFHAWVMYELIVGVVSGSKLKAAFGTVDAEAIIKNLQVQSAPAFPQTEAPFQETPAFPQTEAPFQETAAFPQAEAPFQEVAENAQNQPVFEDNGLPDAAPLRDYNGKGRVIISLNKYGASVAFVVFFNHYEAVIDGKVYAEVGGIGHKGEAAVNYHGVKWTFSVNQKFTSTSIKVTANDEVVAELSERL